MIRVIYYRDKCIGCNSCSDLSPSRWIINDQDGKSDLIEATPKRNNLYILQTTDDEEDDLMNAAESCPVNIIEVKSF